MSVRGPYIETITGMKFYPLSPRPEEVRIEDIAHALSMQCRYTGHTEHFYSVAEHSILASDCVELGFELEALLHDAAEAYISDVAQPVKHAIPRFGMIEEGVLSAVAEALDLAIVDGELPEPVKEVDYRLLADERRVLLPRSKGEEWFPDGEPEPLGVSIVGMLPQVARAIFLSRFDRIQKARHGS